MDKENNRKNSKIDKILTIDDWQDGALLGLCTLNGGYCVYERIFSEERDDYTDEYFLTPIDETAAAKISENYRKWCDFMNGGGKAIDWKNSVDISEIAKSSPRYREFKKRGIFSGKLPDNFHSEISGFFVSWE